MFDKPSAVFQFSAIFTIVNTKLTPWALFFIERTLKIYDVRLASRK